MAQALSMNITGHVFSFVSQNTRRVDQSEHGIMFVWFRQVSGLEAIELQINSENNQTLFFEPLLRIPENIESDAANRSEQRLMYNRLEQIACSREN